MESEALQDISRPLASLPLLMAAAALQGCGPGNPDAGPRSSGVIFERVAIIRSNELPEISGIETRPGPQYIVHNDDGNPDLFILDVTGSIMARYRIDQAKNRDWEDITWVEAGGEKLLAIGDIGDNLGRRRSIRIYFVALPEVDSVPSNEPVELAARHVVELTYPDGPRDCEALAYDSTGQQLLLLSKRDKPPRLYGINASSALEVSLLELEFLGEAPNFRPPTREDFRHLGQESAWISQPTGMDINADGTLAAVITYRSLYLFERRPGQSWVEAFGQVPREFLGPPSLAEEAVAFSPDMQALVISSEGHAAPIYRAQLPAPVAEDR